MTIHNAAMHFRNSLIERDNHIISEEDLRRISAAADYLTSHYRADYVTTRDLMRITDNMLAALGDEPWDLDGMSDYVVGFWEATIMYQDWSI